MNVVAIQCPEHTFELPSGSYTLPFSDAGSESQPCGSGFEGSISFECQSDFTWAEPEDRCRMFSLSFSCSCSYF